MSFKYPLGAVVAISVSCEVGHVKGRAEYGNSESQYYVHYLAADGRAVNDWFEESEIRPASSDGMVTESVS
ncbi:hypothetical protein [Limnobaculum xujianqingii]|uniref:hypothetical protein n=1 Tax=Limnobaculum xujianqingii TaxID=2738837 RepID=UPI001127FA12|nr:hypothetical protein [Limnobaculum xujianqingii]